MRVVSTMVHSLRQHRHQAARGRAPSPRLGRTRESALVPTPPRDRLRPAAFLADRARWWNRCVEPTRTCFASSGCTPRSLRLCPVSRGGQSQRLGSEPQRQRVGGLGDHRPRMIVVRARPAPPVGPAPSQERPALVSRCEAAPPPRHRPPLPARGPPAPSGELRCAG